MFSLPNVLTLSRIAAIPLVVACFWLDDGWAQWLSASLFAIAGITDCSAVLPAAATSMAA